MTRALPLLRLNHKIQTQTQTPIPNPVRSPAASSALCCWSWSCNSVKIRSSHSLCPNLLLLFSSPLPLPRTIHSIPISQAQGATPFLCCGHKARHDSSSNTSSFQDMFGSDDDLATQIPTQTQSLVEGSASASGAVLLSQFKPVPDVDYLQELLAIQQQGPRAIGFFGTRNMGFMHQQLIEILSYAMVITKNHIYTSGASGTNAAVIRGALRAEKPELLTVILPQSLRKQPPESQELLSKVKNVIEMPHNDHLPLIEASRLCNRDIISHVQQVICFAFHDSRLLMETCQEAKNLRKIVTLFYLD